MRRETAVGLLADANLIDHHWNDTRGWGLGENRGERKTNAVLCADGELDGRGKFADGERS